METSHFVLIISLTTEFDVGVLSRSPTSDHHITAQPQQLTESASPDTKLHPPQPLYLIPLLDNQLLQTQTIKAID